MSGPRTVQFFFITFRLQLAHNRKFFEATLLQIAWDSFNREKFISISICFKITLNFELDENQSGRVYFPKIVNFLAGFFCSQKKKYKQKFPASLTHPNQKNNNDQAYSCLRNWRLSASWRSNSTLPPDPDTLGNQNTIVLRL